MKGANYIKECGKTIAVAPSNAKTFTLEELQKFVGGYIQMIHLKNGDIMVINEEGKLNAFRVNDKATEFFQKDFGEIDVIVGNVLITSSKFVN